MSREFLYDLSEEQIERGRDLNAQVNPFIQMVLNAIGDDPDTKERFKHSNSSNFLYEELLSRSKATNPELYPLFLAQNRIMPGDIKGLEPICLGAPMEGAILIGRDGINLVKTEGVYKTLQSMVRMLVAKDGNQVVLDIYSDKVTAGIRMDSNKLYEKTKPSRTARLLALAENGYEILGWVYLEFDQVPEYLQKQ